jgi:hypothetical protein
MRRKRSTGEKSRLRRLMTVLSAVVGLVALVVASPLLLAWAASWPIAWHQLSEVGQAYGTISAVLSALAFSGVAVSVFMQREQYRVSEQQAVRQRQFELLKFSMENPRYMDVWGAHPPGSRPDPQHEPELRAFANLILSHWYMLWRIGNVSELELRAVTRNFFRGAIGHEFWSRSGSSWILGPDPLARRFLQVLNEEYANAEAEGPPVPATPDRVTTDAKESLQEAAASQLRGPLKIAAGVGVGLIAGYLTARKRRRE